MTSPAARLRALLDRPGLLVMPGCHDAMSARLIEEAGFELGFMSGFAVSAARLGMPDTGLISYAELADQAQNICRAVSIPLIGDLGADITFLEAPLGVEEMRRYCQEVDGPKMANLIEGGKTPLLPHAELEAIGYKIAVYPLTMLNVSIVAMRAALQQLSRGQATAAMTFEDSKRVVGFPEDYAEEARYKNVAAGL